MVCSWGAWNVAVGLLVPTQTSTYALANDEPPLFQSILKVQDNDSDDVPPAEHSVGQVHYSSTHM